MDPNQSYTSNTVILEALKYTPERSKSNSKYNAADKIHPTYD